MTTDVVHTFQRQLDRVAVEWSRVSPAEATPRLAELVDELDGPAVGSVDPCGIALPAPVTVDPTPRELADATTGITPASLGVADYGSILLESTPEGTEQHSLFPDRHIAVLRTENVVPTMAAAFEWLGPRLRAARDEDSPRCGSTVIATGPSATADMGALVRGAHGPKAVHVVLVDSGTDDGRDRERRSDR